MVEYRCSEDTHQAIATPAPRLLSPPHPLTPAWGTRQNSQRYAPLPRSGAPASAPLSVRSAPLFQIAPRHFHDSHPTPAALPVAQRSEPNSPAVVLCTFRPCPPSYARRRCFTTHCRGQYSARPPSCRAPVLSSRLLRWLHCVPRLRRLGVCWRVIQSGRSQSLCSGASFRMAQCAPSNRTPPPHRRRHTAQQPTAKLCASHV